MKSFLVCCLLLLGGLSARAAAAPQAVAVRPQAVVVILLPGTSLQDWQNAAAPNLHHLMQTGAVAVMNTRTAHRAGAHEQETGQSALLTLGAGARAAGTAGADAGFLPAQVKAPGLTVLAGNLYTRRTGLLPQPGQYVCLDWPAVLSANADLGYDLRLGSLAETLTAQGGKVGAGGGADADWAAAGPNGTVRHLSRLQAAPGLCVIWDAGPNIAAADALIGTAASQIARLHGRLIVISPYAGNAAYAKGERLTPVLAWGPNLPAGLLVSPSTRRPGLVTNTDFAPAVAACFGIPRTSFRPQPFGFNWSGAASAGAVGSSARLGREAAQQARGMALLPYVALGLGLWICAATLFSVRRSLPNALALAPFCAVAAALFAVSALSFWMLLPVILTLSAACARFRGKNSVLTFLAAGLTTALTLDMITGNVLLHRSLLGYSAVEGARYYGIGNEAVGLLLGTALVTVARLWNGSRTQRVILTLLMGGMVLLLGSAGAKAGGVPVSLALFGTFLYTVSGRRWTIRTAALLAGVAAAGLALAALGDAFLLPHPHSHVGEAVKRITAGGSGEAWDIVRRKLATEIRLAYHSTWAALLWPGVLGITALWKRKPLSSLADSALRTAAGVGLFACLLLNDAGVVAAALFAVILWSDAMTQNSLPAPKSLDAGRL